MTDTKKTEACPRKMDKIDTKIKFLMDFLNQMDSRFSRSDERKIKRFDKRCCRLKNRYQRMVGKSPELCKKTSLIILFNAGKVNNVHVTGAGSSVKASVISFLLNERFMEYARVAVDIAGPSGGVFDATESKPDKENEAEGGKQE